MNIRIKFAKYGMMKFIGHLDIMRYFQKAMRRADIDIAYSGGFSPHQIMSFAAPLGVGITSQGEYLDIAVHSTENTETSLKALNEAMVEGIRVLQYRALPEGAKNAMSLVAAASYAVTFKESGKNPFTRAMLGEALEKFYRGQPEILITKQTKKSEKVMDLKPLIYDLGVSVPHCDGGAELLLPSCGNGVEFLKAEDTPGFYMTVCTGSTDNVKPELVLSAFGDYCRAQGICGFEFQPAQMQIHRLEVYAAEQGRLVTLGELGQDIL